MLTNKGNRNKWRHLAGALALVWMCVIFGFSAQTKEESSVVSEGLSYQLVNSTGLLFHLHLDEEQLQVISMVIEHYVRKAAHMTEYAILSILLYLWFGYWEWKNGKKILLAALVAALYAASDEFHQLFVPGRAAAVGDVLIDSSGALLGVIMAGVVSAIMAAHRRR